MSGATLLRNLLDANSNGSLRVAIQVFDSMEASLAPSIGRFGGNFLECVGALPSVRRILELGTFFGYSALRLSSHGARVTSIEMNSENASIARKVVDLVGVRDRVKILEGDVLKVLPTLHRQEPFDVLFIDHAKKHYLSALLAAEPLLRSNALVIADNVSASATHMLPYLRRVANRELYHGGLFVEMPLRAGRTTRDSLHMCTKC